MHKKFFLTFVSITGLALIGGGWGVTTSWAMYSDDIARGVARGIKMAEEERKAEKRRLIEKQDRERKRVEWERSPEGVEERRKKDQESRDKFYRNVILPKEKEQKETEEMKRLRGELQGAHLFDSFNVWYYQTARESPDDKPRGQQNYNQYYNDLMKRWLEKTPAEREKALQRQPLPEKVLPEKAPVACCCWPWC